MNRCETLQQSGPGLAVSTSRNSEAKTLMGALGLSRTALITAVLGWVLLSLGASRFPHGGFAGFLMGLAGFVMCLVFTLALGEGKGTRAQRLMRIPLAIVGLLLLWAGTIASAIVVANYYFSRVHYLPASVPGEIVPAVACAVIAPALLTFKGGSWMGLNRWALAALWAYWLAFYALTVLATAFSQPWGSTP